MAKDLKRDLITGLGHRPLATINRTDLAVVLDKIKTRAAVQAKRVLQYTKAMFGRFVERSLIEQSPAVRLRKRTKEQPRDLVLTSDELAALWLACERDGTWFGALIHLLMLIGMRRGEPFAARLEPAGRRLTVVTTKQGTAPVVTLPRQAVAPAQRFLGDAVKDARVKSLGWSKRWLGLLKAAGLLAGSFCIHETFARPPSL